jgi:hypothetical protein
MARKLGREIFFFWPCSRVCGTLRVCRELRELKVKAVCDLAKVDIRELANSITTGIGTPCEVVSSRVISATLNRPANWTRHSRTNPHFSPLPAQVWNWAFLGPCAKLMSLSWTPCSRNSRARSRPSFCFTASFPNASDVMPGWS